MTARTGGGQDSDEESGPGAPIVGFDDAWAQWRDEPGPRMLHEFVAIPSFDPVREPSETAVRIMSGLPRMALRHTPVSIVVGGLLALVVFLLTGRLFDVYHPGSVFRPVWSVAVVLLLVVGAHFLASTGMFDGWHDGWKAMLVYGVVVGLASLVAVASALAIGELRPGGTHPDDRIVYASGLFLASYLGGALAYDTVRRFELMLSNLDDLDVVDGGQYEDFLEKTRSRIEFEGYDGIPGIELGWLSPSRLFALTFAAFFVGVWFAGKGPVGLHSTSLTVVNGCVVFLAVLFIVRFMAVSQRLRSLLEKHGADGRPVLGYDPFHPDGAGGYAVLGSNAMRLNHLLILAGLYYVYRISVVGLRVRPEGGRPLIVWSVNYLGPVVIYLVVALLWMYATFWELHRHMLRQKRKTNAAIRRRVVEDGVRLTGSDVPGLDHGVALSDRTLALARSLDEETLFARLDSAPVWPVSNRRLYATIAANMLPVMLSLVQAF